MACISWVGEMEGGNAVGLTVDDDEGDKLVDAGVSIDVVVVSG